ncbi:hypothetical protein [Marinobacter sp. JSM 1782161]|uniref:hypothetical protein n=1 Tax=Marinobacter sp. JSM 1782161 TaxID=2685906 RepID=UPI0014041CDD|nr:hypothetical protein [Marinobacter sp. JSM 1782161]
MLVHEQQVRLTPREQRVLWELTGADPSTIRTREDLRQFVERHLDGNEQEPERLRQLKAVLAKYLAAI